MAVKRTKQPFPAKQVSIQANAPETDLSDKWAVKIDYVTVCSSELYEVREPSQENVWSVTNWSRSLFRRCGLLAFTEPSFGAWELGAGRSGYGWSVRHTSGAVLFCGHPTQSPVLECGGAACDLLYRSGELMPWVAKHCEHVTRLDLAGDLVCDLTPVAFLAYGRSGVHKASGAKDSAKGSTRYIGSETSIRRCRVYRYFPPHPRADALRVEAVLRGKLAKHFAFQTTVARLDDLWSEAIRPFAFKCPQCRLPTQSIEPLLTLKNEPTSAGRLRWLEQQIRPALLNAHRAGLIDLPTWFDDVLKALPASTR